MKQLSLVTANIATMDPKAERAAGRAGRCQGQRAEELERLFDQAGADLVAVQEHRLQLTGQRSGAIYDQFRECQQAEHHGCGIMA